MTTLTASSTDLRADRSQSVDYAQQAYQILRFAFVVAPIAAGADKFLHLLVNWDQYLAPMVNRMLGGHGHEFMLAVGAIEIVAGLGVAFKPRILPMSSPPGSWASFAIFSPFRAISMSLYEMSG